MSKTALRYPWALADDCARPKHLVFSFSGLLEPGLNGTSGLIREHYRKKILRQKRLASLVMVQVVNRRVGAMFPCKVRYTRHYAGQPMDFVNAAASFKHLEDVLVKANVIPDDNPKIVTDFSVTQVKVAKKSEEGTVVEYIHDPKREGFR